MSGKMLEYIREQAPMAQAMLADRAVITAPFIETFGTLRPKRVVLLGSGSSHYVCKMAKPTLEALLGVEVTACPPTLMPPATLLDVENTLFFAISQGGSSSSTVDVVNSIRTAGGRVVAITGGVETLAGQASNLNLVLRCGEETLGPKTKGVLCSVLTLVLVGLAWSDTLGRAPALREKLLADMEKAVGLMPGNIQQALDWCDIVMPAMAPAEHLVMVAEKEDRGPALEGAMKLLETICRPVVAYEFEEYLHGCFCMISEKSNMLFFLPRDAGAAKRFYALADYCRGKGAKCWLVGRAAFERPEPDGLVLASSENDLLSFFEFLVPSQVLSAQMSAFVGIDIEAGVLRDFSAAVPFHVGEPRPWEQA